jgi:hypothetical protein
MALRLDSVPLSFRAPRPSNGYVPFQRPFYSVLQEEDAAAGGYLTDKWKDAEKSELIIALNTVFRASVGLDQSFSVEEIATRRALRGVGMLTIPLLSMIKKWNGERVHDTSKPAED